MQTTQRCGTGSVVVVAARVFAGVLFALTAPGVGQMPCNVEVLAQDLSAGVPGPRLWTPSGAPVLGTDFVLQVRDAPADSFGLLVVGSEDVALPFGVQGGLWHPGNVFATAGFVTDALGVSPGFASVPAIDPSLCGLVLVAQALVADSCRLGGKALSNGLLLRAGEPRGSPYVFARFAAPGIADDFVSSDLDGDGVLDAVIAHTVSSSLSILLGEGDGLFSAESVIALGFDARCVDVGDVDGDGHADLVVGSQLVVPPFGVGVLLGHGDGTFGPVTAFPCAVRPDALELVDLDGDLAIDVLVSSESGDALATLLGMGDGTFGASAVFATSDSPRELAAGDLDGDGFPDAVHLDVVGQQVARLLGDGTGGLGVPQGTTVGAVPLTLLVADLDGDGALDAVTAMPGNVDVLLGSGAGDLLPPIATPIDPGWVMSLASADLEGDGVLDLVLSHSFANDRAVLPLHGIGDGTFDPGDASMTGDASGLLHLADVDRNGTLDALIASYGVLVLVHGLGTGAFEGAQQVEPPFILPGAFAVGDVDGDGLSDVVLTTHALNKVSILLAQSDGGYGASTQFPSGDKPSAVDLADIDDDGVLDLLMPALKGREIWIWRGVGDGTFFAPSMYRAGSGPSDLEVVDLDGDGDLDVAIANAWSHQLTLLLNDGAGDFADLPFVYVGKGPEKVSSADLNGDGVPDLVLPLRQQDDLSVLLGRGDGTFAAPTWFACGSSPTDVALADLDGDGKLDAAICRQDKMLSVMRGDGTGRFGPPAEFPTMVRGAEIALADADGDGRLDAVVRADSSPGPCALLAGRHDATFAMPVLFGASGYAQDMLVIDVDVDGMPDVLLSGHIPDNFLIHRNRIGH